ncbi:hypothetical protein SAMD00019534_037460, partial [Acytostelium subglobosum LB1]|uniref:hypothetical protein n=1 Tax=Acytostelium subglobosum LB1 TaxID=1410327 RepID=UPI00064512BD
MNHRVDDSEIDELYQELGIRRDDSRRLHNIGGYGTSSNFSSSSSNNNNSSNNHYNIDVHQQQQQPDADAVFDYRHHYPAAASASQSNVIRQTTTQSSSVIKKKKKPLSWYSFSNHLFKEFCTGIFAGIAGFLFRSFKQYRLQHHS